MGAAAPDRMLWTAVQGEASMGPGKEGKALLCHQALYFILFFSWIVFLFIFLLPEMSVCFYQYFHSDYIHQ